MSERESLVKLGDVFVALCVARYIFCASRARQGRILDIATGSGYGAYLLAELTNSQVVGMDISKNAIEYAAKYYKHKNIKFVVGNILDLSEDMGKFDTIISCETIEHISEIQQHAFIKKINSILVPGGKVIMSTPNKRHFSGSGVIGPPNDFHIHELSPEELRQLLSTINDHHVTLFYQPYVSIPKGVSGKKSRPAISNMIRTMLPEKVKDYLRVYHRSMKGENPIGKGIIQWMWHHKSLTEQYAVKPFSEEIANSIRGFIFGVVE